MAHAAHAARPAHAAHAAEDPPGTRRPRRCAPELAALEARTLARMLRYALRTGGDVLRLRPGARPLLAGLGGPRELRYRQLTGDDTRAAMTALFEGLRARTPSSPARAGEAPWAEGAEGLPWLVAGPDGSLLEVHAEVAAGGPALTVTLLRPLTEAPRLDVQESRSKR